MEIELSKLLDWSEPKRVYTKRGYRILQKATPDKNFWTVWNANKTDMKKAGMMPSKKEDGTWEVLWWKTDVETEQTKLDSRRVSAKVKIPKPKGLEYLPFQKAGIDFAVKHDSVLFSDEMGLGKTIQAIGTLNTMDKINHVLIIVPKRLKINWHKELTKWLTHDVSIGIVKDGNEWVEANIVIINYDILYKHKHNLHAIEWDAIIIDEAHYLKNSKAKRTQVVLGNGKDKKPIQARKKLLLTGTPILNRPVEGFTIFNYLDPVTFRNFFTYAKKYCNAYKHQWGWDFSGASNTEELQDRIRSLFMIRRLKADVLTELPPKRRQIIEIPANGNAHIVAEENAVASKFEAQRDELKRRAEEAKDLDKDEYEKIVSQLRQTTQAMFTEMSKVRHQTALAKVEDVCSHIENMVEEGVNKIVVFAHHRDVIEQIHEHFKDNSVILFGGMSAEDSEKSITEFQNNPQINIFIGNIQAAGVGITLTASSNVVFAELDWVPANLSQAEDRLHRIGQQESVLVQHLVLEDSFDSRMAQAIVEKQNIIDGVLDNEPTKPEIKPKKTIKKTPKTIKVDLTPKKRTEKSYTPEMKQKMIEGLQIIAGMCDGAQAKDFMGFNRFDSPIGKSLASQSFLSDKQADLAHKLLIKYNRQLPEDFLKGIKKC